MKHTAQFNVNWRGIPTYEDYLTNQYDYHDGCGIRTYTVLDQCVFLFSLICSKRLTCEKIEKNRFECKSVVESTWVRIWDPKYHQHIITLCGKQWMEEYQDVMYTNHSFRDD